MTIICSLPSLPVGYFGICSLLSSAMSAPTLRLETGRLNSLPSGVKSKAISRLSHFCSRGRRLRYLGRSKESARIRFRGDSGQPPAGFLSNCSCGGYHGFSKGNETALRCLGLFCRNSAALSNTSFSFIRIWCVSIVLTLTFNSFANSEAPSPLPIKDKISRSRSFQGVDIEVSRAFNETR